MDKRYCAAPWRGLHINPKGDVKTCCAGNPNMLGNLNRSDIGEILHSTTMLAIRDTIKNGVLHPQYCSNCIQAERYGNSERNWHNDINADFDVSTAEPTDHQPVILDIRWNTTCNFSCNYCGPLSSSKWAIMLNDHSVDQKTRTYLDQVCEYIKSHGSSIKEVALVGGEPLLLKENEQVLDIIPKDSIVTLITNLNVDFEKNNIVKKLSQRQRVGWSISFENISERFEYVRYGGDWQLILKNVKSVIELINTKGHWGGIHAVYNIYSATRLRELKQLATELGISIHWQTLHDPAYLDPANHPQWIKHLCTAEIDKYLHEFDASENETKFLTEVENRLSIDSTQDPEIYQRFQEHIYKIEHLYHPDRQDQFKKLWPELAPLISQNS